MAPEENMLCPPRALVAIGLGLLCRGDEIAFRPSEGAVLRRTITRVIDFDPALRTTEGAGFCTSVLVNEVRERFVVVDAYAEVDDGFPKRITRRFVELGGEEAAWPGIDEKGCASSRETRSILSSQLEGLTVCFVWDDGDDAYEVEYLDGQGDDRLLEGLVPELDLQGVLPTKEVYTGLTWESDDPALFLRDPGGIVLTKEGGDRRSPTIDSSSCTATFQGVFDDHGVEVAVIGIEAALTTVYEDPHAQGFALGYPIETHETTTTEYDLKGELVWNVSGGHLHRLELRGNVTRTTQAEWQARTDSFSWGVASEGTVELIATVEV